MVIENIDQSWNHEIPVWDNAYCKKRERIEERERNSVERVIWIETKEQNIGDGAWGQGKIRNTGKRSEMSRYGTK